MTQIVFIVLCTLAVTISAAELDCGLGEAVDNCPNECYEYCPEDENYSRSCEKPNSCLAPACKCRFNYRKAKNGTCIPARECPPFPCKRDNEEYASCPALCPTDDCSQATLDGRCPVFGYMLIVTECRPACRCKKGYWRKQGKCVPYDECPEKDKNEPPAPLFPFIY